MRPVSLKCMWNGSAFVPSDRQLGYCRKEFGEGEIVTLERNEEISAASRGHYFASLNEAWHQLPETEKRFPSVDHMRTWALIQAGYCDQRSITCETPQEAATIAAFVTPLNHYAIVDVRDNVVRVFTAKSQSSRSMSKKDFQDSKDKVLEIVAGLVGVSVDKLTSNAGKAA